MSKDTKLIRGQVRQVVKETLPSLLQTEVFHEMYATLQKEMIAKLEYIHNDIQESLKRMNSKAQDVQAFMLNQMKSDMGRRAPNVTINTPNDSTTLEPKPDTIVG